MEFLTVLGGLSLWFWLVAAVVFLIAVVSVENEKFSVTTPVVVLGIAGLIWLSGARGVFDWVRDNIGTIALATLVYLVVGVVYGFIRYVFYVHKIADKFSDWSHSRGYTGKSVTQSQAYEFARHARINSFPLKVADSKSRIIFWCIYWPFSAPWTLINEPVKRFFNFAYRRMAGTLQGVSDRAFKHVEIVADPVKESKGLTGGRQILHD